MCAGLSSPHADRLTVVISSTLRDFFSMVLMAASFFCSYSRVPAASSSMLSDPTGVVKASQNSRQQVQPETLSHLRISGGFMFNTLVIRPCMIRKWGLLTLSWTE